MTGDATNILTEKVDDRGITRTKEWTFQSLMEELSKKFDYTGLYYELENKINAMYQRQGEDEFDFADRVVAKARKLPMSAESRQRMVMRIFTNHVTNLDLRSYFIDYEPKTIKRAKEIVEKFRTKQRVGLQG